MKLSTENKKKKKTLKINLVTNANKTSGGKKLMWEC